MMNQLILALNVIMLALVVMVQLIMNVTNVILGNTLKELLACYSVLQIDFTMMMKYGHAKVLVQIINSSTMISFETRAFVCKNVQQKHYSINKNVYFIAKEQHIKIKINALIAILHVHFVRDRMLVTVLVALKILS